jgi:hypothetical protein
MSFSGHVRIVITTHTMASDTHVGATAAQLAAEMPMPAYEISSTALARYGALVQSDQFSLESATKARHRGDHRQRGVSGTPVSQTVRVTPNPSRTDAS